MKAISKHISFLTVIVIPLAYMFILLSSLFYQFSGELPCELCLMQRWSMLLAMSGQILILVQSLKNQLTLKNYLTGQAISILSAMVGGSIALHQLLLNNKPHKTPFGPATLGIHTWTWSLLTFIILIVYVCIMLTFAESIVENFTNEYKKLTKFVIYFYVALVLLILLLTFFEGGLHANFVETRYQLFYDF